jgi:hypothetical protein
MTYQHPAEQHQALLLDRRVVAQGRFPFRRSKDVKQFRDIELHLWHLTLVDPFRPLNPN